MSRPLRVAVVAAVAVCAFYIYPPVRFLALKAVGRSPYCPLSNAIDARINEKSQERYYNDILKASHLVEKDPAGQSHRTQNV